MKINENKFKNEDKKEACLKSNSIEKYWTKSPELFEDDLEFLKWFDDYPSFEAYWSSGYIDLNQRILNKKVLREIQQTYDKKVLEIGYGGGRILNAASSMFKEVFGVDVHNCCERVSNLSPNKLSKNILLKPEEIDSKIDDGSLDLIYSFIVFQHFENIDKFHFYVEVIKKKLKKGGIFNIYYGVNRYNDSDYFLMPKEELQRRGSSLFIKPDYCQKYMMDNSLEIIAHNIAAKNPWFTPEEFPSNTQAFIVGKNN